MSNNLSPFPPYQVCEKQRLLTELKCAIDGFIETTNTCLNTCRNIEDIVSKLAVEISAIKAQRNIPIDIPNGDDPMKYS